MRILVVGGGGREHALAWKCAQSAQVEQVIVAPGNAGTAKEPKCVNAGVGAEDIDALLTLAVKCAVDLTIVGPEAPLVAGITDRFTERGLRIFGPASAAAMLEGSKQFAKAFMARHGVPTASYASFTALAQAEAHILEHGAPVVVKADGLAAGKGVTVAHDVDTALAAVRASLEGNAFGEAGHSVVVEAFLPGEEASFICLVSGRQVVPLASSQDHKARDDGDRGPNTGGMGAYSPAPIVDDALHARVMREIIEPTVNGLADDGLPFVGFLYAGLMVAPDGTPRVLEFNVRGGDPETQPLMMRMKSDFVALVEAAIEGRLDAIDVEWDPRVALGVVMAAGGYPESYRKGDRIGGLRSVGAGAKVFHAGTALDGDSVVTAGGRVLCVTALGDGIAAAQDGAYAAVGVLNFENAQYRKDIGDKARR